MSSVQTTPSSSSVRSPFFRPGTAPWREEGAPQTRREQGAPQTWLATVGSFLVSGATVGIEISRTLRGLKDVGGILGRRVVRVKEGRWGGKWGGLAGGRGDSGGGSGVVPWIGLGMGGSQWPRWSCGPPGPTASRAGLNRHQRPPGSRGTRRRVSTSMTADDNGGGMGRGIRTRD